MSSSHPRSSSHRFRWLLLFCASWALVAEAAVPSYETVRAGFRSSYAELLDRHGEFLHAQRLDMQVNRLHWVALADISPALPEAVVFAEDRDFYTHRGIDWGATARATLGLVGGSRGRGASTISMQVAALLEPELSWQKGGRSLGQKWRQMEAAHELEKHWSKAQILEAYLNLTQFRGDLQGVAAASRALFNKSPRTLTRAEGLVLAALLPSPAAPGSRIAQRGCTLIVAGFPDTNCQAVKDVALSSLDRRRAALPEDPALAALASRLLKAPGERLHTSIDATVQRQAEDALRSQLADLRARRVNAGAVLVLDNATGEVLAYVANAGLVDSARYVDGIQAWRQAGSTLKPFLYGLAFENRYLTAASVLEDAPISLATPNGLYTPQNYEGDFKGPVSARTALAGSLNIPAVRVLSVVGVDAFWQRLRDLGYSSLTEAPDFYGYALALGSADVNLWMQAGAFRALADGGRYLEPTLETGRATEAKPVMDAGAAFIVADILSDRGARAITFGLENPLSLPFWAAVKTGTSKDMRDNWCVGFSRRYTVAVWVGNMDGAPMRDVSGITGAAPVWAQVMRGLEGGQVRLGETEKATPENVVRQGVQFAGLPEPARNEWFLRGTEMERVEYLADTSVRILYPANETLIAMDPDIPRALQRVRFRAEGAEKLLWVLDGKVLGLARDYDWFPTPGSHRLVLRDAAGKELDAVVFTVRGRLRAP